MAGLIRRTELVSELGQVTRFLVAGAANTAFAFAIYAAGLAWGAGYQLASLGALVAGICSGFVIQGKVAFRSRLAGRFAPFVALWALLYLANLVLIGALHFFGINLYLAGFLSAVPLNVFAYLALRSVIFAPGPIPKFRVLLLWVIGLLFVARLYIVTHLSLNWDEFLNLSMLYDFRRGEMTNVFQTAFVHLFHWLPLVSTNEADQLVAARLAMLVFAACTSFAIFHAARRFMPVESALVAVIAFNCFGASFLYGSDFRTDTLATAAMTGAIALAAHKRATRLQMAGVAVLIAVGGVLTIKSIFLLPTIGLLIITNALATSDWRRTVKMIAASGALCVMTFAAILSLHAVSLAQTASAASFLRRTGGATLLTGDYSVLMQNWPVAILGNVVFWFLVVWASASLLRRDGSDQSLGRTDRVALAGMLLPALVPLVYSEVYPYFHPFLIAPIAIVAGFGFSRMAPLAGRVLLILLFVGLAGSVFRRLDDGLAEQRKVLALVHRLFPAPVPYIDHTSMVSSFPKKGFFMSRWGITDYRKADRPIMAGIIRTDQPKFLLETRDLLAVDRIVLNVAERSGVGLFGTDIAALRDNYVRYWGPLFLPGKNLQGSGVTRLEIGGAYRLTGKGRLVANGTSYVSGDTVRLMPGDYVFSSKDDFGLRWAAPAPPSTPPPARLFSGW